jgi:GH15 family glucan-1,4-alpha-glucosidase
MAAVEEKLSVPGGLARFENDGYMRSSPDVTGNAWFLCTLWLAEYFIASARAEADLEKPLTMLKQVAENASASGVLSEQMDPTTGEHTSVAPLTWSHSTYVAAVESFLQKLDDLK